MGSDGPQAQAPPDRMGGRRGRMGRLAAAAAEAAQAGARPRPQARPEDREADHPGPPRAEELRLGPERGADDAVLLAQVRGRIPLARARAPRAADVEERDALRLRLLEPVANRPPCAHVLRLFLHPDELAEVRVAGEQRLRLLDREGIQLLEPRNGDSGG